MIFKNSINNVKVCITLLGFVSAKVFAQHEIKLDDLSQFSGAGTNWTIVGDVVTDQAAVNFISVTPGKGILINKPTDQARTNILTTIEHGDIDLELDFMMTKNSNSGTYLMGNYEIQLFDSWGKVNPTAQDCGAIYERWDDTKKDAKGYLGVAPRENACKAPGLWQRIKISFDAPKFKNGVKTNNARINYVYLNGVLIHENVDLSGPTRGALSSEKPVGALLIQGDHGAVAIRNIKYTSYQTDKISWSGPVKYEYYEQAFNESRLNIWEFKPKKTGTTELLTYEVSDLTDKFAIKFSGNLNISKPGIYDLYMGVNGSYQLIVNGDTLEKAKNAGGWDSKKVNLRSGQNSVILTYWKNTSWINASLGFFISGMGYKMQPLHEYNSFPPNPKNPIMEYGAMTETKVVRSFIRHKSSTSTHAASVGFPAKINITLDPENFSLLKIWKGSFVDMSNAWGGRGGEPIESIGGPFVNLESKQSLAVLKDQTSVWPSISAEDKSNLKLESYYIDEQGIPHFNFKKGNMIIEDVYTPEDGNKALSRTLKLKSADNLGNMYCFVAQAEKIEVQKDGSYLIGDKEYIIKLKPNTKAVIRENSGHKELLLPVLFANGTSVVSYSFVW